MKGKFFMGILGGMGVLACAGFSGCAETAKYTVQLVTSVRFPACYYIEYEITNEDGTVSYIGKGIDGEGNYRYKTAEGELLYIKTGDNYETYELTNGVWTDKNMPVKLSYVEEHTEEFDDYAKKSMEKFNGQYKKGEQTSWLGMTCDSYKLTLNILSTFKQTYEMLTEVDTGICMRYFAYTNVGGVETDTNGFECIEFTTETLDFSSVLG